MGRVCVGRLCYGPSLQWAEFAMGRDVQLPLYRTDTAIGQTNLVMSFTLLPLEVFDKLSNLLELFQTSLLKWIIYETERLWVEFDSNTTSLRKRFASHRLDLRIINRPFGMPCSVSNLR